MSKCLSYRICKLLSSPSWIREAQRGNWRILEALGRVGSLFGPNVPLITVTLPAEGMARDGIWLLCLQLVLRPTLVPGIKMEIAIKNFRTLHVDYPRINYPKGFHGYCNGLMAYLRGRMQDWYCPKIHYVVHAPWEGIQKFCRNSENFCENYNEYCTLTQNSFPITVCTRGSKKPPTSCSYNSTLTNQRLYLLCSSKQNAVPIGIIGLY